MLQNHPTRAVKTDKRQWVYGGLGMPRGAAVVRGPAARRRQLGRVLVLIGGVTAQALGAPLARLATASGRELHVFAGAVTAPLLARITAIRPALVLLVSARPYELSPQLKALPHAWLSAVSFPRHSGRVGTALWYAAWAGHIWKQLNGETTWQSTPT